MINYKYSLQVLPQECYGLHKDGPLTVLLLQSNRVYLVTYLMLMKGSTLRVCLKSIFRNSSGSIVRVIRSNTIK